MKTAEAARTLLRWVLTAVLAYVAAKNSHWSIGLSLALIFVSIEAIVAREKSLRSHRAGELKWKGAYDRSIQRWCAFQDSQKAHPWQERAVHIHERFIAGKWETWHNEDLRFLTLALAGEVGEFANLLKKQWRGDGLLDVREAGKELADIRIYLELISQCLALDLDEEADLKLDEVELRLHQRGL